MIVCTFTALEDPNVVKQGLPIVVLRAMVAAGRFSMWDATRTHRLAKTITRLYDWGLLERGKDTDLGFPWTKVILTSAGRAALDAGVVTPPQPARFVCRVCGRKPGRHVVVHGSGPTETYTCAPCWLTSNGDHDVLGR